MMVAVMAFAGGSFAAEGPALEPAEYKPLPEGTRIKYDNRIYTVSRTDGFLTVFKTLSKGGLSEYLKAHALFGEFKDSMFATRC